jgi:hypothetical protein
MQSLRLLEKRFQNCIPTVLQLPCKTLLMALPYS